MREDIYYFKEEAFVYAEAIYNTIILNGVYPVIAIGGVSGSQKTEISVILAQKLNDINIHTRVLSLDSYYVSEPENREKWRKENNCIGKAEIRWRDIKKFIYEHRHYDTIIIEGLYALYYDKIDFGVFLDRTLAETYDFRKDRGKENPDDEWRKFVLEKECEEVFNSKINANLTL